MSRFKLGPNDPYFRYMENGILYSAFAIEFNLDQVEEAFDKGFFVPSIDYKTNKPNFTRKNEPVYYLPHDVLTGKIDVQIMVIDNTKFTKKIFIKEDITGYTGRHYQDCTFYDCHLISKNHVFDNCRFVRCIIDGNIIYDCDDFFDEV